MISILYKKVRKVQKELIKEAKKEVSKSNKAKAKAKKLLEKILNSCKGYDNKGKIVPYTKKEKENNTYVFNHGHNFIIPIDTFENKDVLFYGNTCNIFNLNASGKIVWIRNDVRSFRLLQSLKKAKSITVIANFITCVYWENLFKHNDITNYKIYTVNDINEKAEKSCYQYLCGYEFKDGKKIGRLKRFFNKMPHFDVIIMNPPYSGNFHLKILNECIKNLKYNTDIIINISPIRWLQDVLYKYKNNTDFSKYQNTICKHIDSLNVVLAKQAAKLFGAEMIMDLGIYKLTKKGGFDCVDFITDSVIEKVLNKMPSSLYEHVKENYDKGWCVRIWPLKAAPSNRNNENANSYNFELLHHSLSSVFYNGYQNGLHWSKIKLKGAGGPKKYTENDSLPNSIPLNTKEEAELFEDSTKTLFYRYLVYKCKSDQNVPLKYLPFMNDYTHPWTDERFCKYFEITEKEWNKIQNDMKIWEEYL